MNLRQGKQKDVGISRLRVRFRNGTVETILSRHGKGEAMYEELALLLVAPRGVMLEVIGNVVEVRRPVTSIGKSAGQFALLMVAETQVGLIVGIQQIKGMTRIIQI